MDHHPNILKPDGSNYSFWSYWMQSSILGIELWELISGSVTKPGPKNQNYTNLLDKWEALNAKSLTLMKDTVDPSIKKRLANFKSAKEAWQFLARLYAQSTLAVKFQLEKEIRAILLNERSIEELFRIMTDYWNILAMMEPIDLSNLDSFKKYKEEYCLVQFLWPLKDEFDSLKWSILGRSPLPSVTEALTELIAGEKRLKAGLDVCCDDRMHIADMYSLEFDIRGIKQRYRSIQELFNVMSGLWDKLVKLEPNDLSNLDSFKNYQEEHQLVQFLIVLNDEFDPLRRSILHGSTTRSVAEAVSQLLAEERRLKSSKHIKSASVPQSQFSSLSLEAKAERLHCDQAGHLAPNCPAILKNNQGKLSDANHGVSQQFGEYHPTSPKHLQQSHNDYQPSSSTTSPASSFEADTVGDYRFMVNLCAEVHSDDFGESPLESGCHFPPRDKEDTTLGTALNTLKILSYNVWFRKDLELDKRMEAIGDLIQKHSPDVICFQEVTPDIYDIFKQSNWWMVYDYSISNEMVAMRPYFCMQLSKLPVKSFSYKPFSNSLEWRGLCMAEIEVLRGKPLIIATSHLASPCPAPPNWDQMYSEERVAQAKEALNHLKKFPNVIFCGDMNWDDELDGHFPLFDGWIDAWTELKPEDNGWTYDTKSNHMLSGNRPLQKRLDRFVCHLHDFKLSSIDMIGIEAIPGLSYFKEKARRNRKLKLKLPVFPSDHYGLLLKIYSQ